MLKDDTLYINASFILLHVAIFPLVQAMHHGNQLKHSIANTNTWRIRKDGHSRHGLASSQSWNLCYNIPSTGACCECWEGWPTTWNLSWCKAKL